MIDDTSPPTSNDDDETLGPDKVDDEDIGRNNSEVRPWDPSKIRITTKHFSLRDVVDQIAEKEIDLSPDFQRDYVWKSRQRTRLVESILLGIPLPAFYFNQDRNGTYQVVDGVQRLSTISLFMNDGHVLDVEDLEYLHNLNGSTYSGLDMAALRRFRSTQIVVHVIEPQTPDEVKYDIFGRVNTLGSPLSAQEIRHAMSKERSRLHLKFLAEHPEFDEATAWSYWRRDPETGKRIRDSGRMTNRELALRFCAFRHYSSEDYRQYSSLDAFLVEYTRRIDGTTEKGSRIGDGELELLKTDFERAMKSASLILGKTAFRRQLRAQKRIGPINRAVFESQSIALADYPTETLLPWREEISQAFQELFDDPEYVRAVTVGTGAPAAVETRLSLPKAMLVKVLN
jgi:hypothetical protein